MATLWIEARDDATGSVVCCTTPGVEAWECICEGARDFYDCRLADIGCIETDDGDKLTVLGEPVASIGHRYSGTTVLAARLPAEIA